MNASESVTKNKVDTIVDTANNIDGSSSSEEEHHTNQSISHSPPVMKVKTKKSEHRETYQARGSTTYTQTNEKKAEQWDSYSKQISPDGVLRLKGLKRKKIGRAHV